MSHLIELSLLNIHCTKKNEVFIKDFFGKCDQIQFPPDMVTCTEDIFDGKLHFLCSDYFHSNKKRKESLETLAVFS